MIQKKPFEIFSHFTTALFGDINIFNVFFNYLEPDPYSEYGSGSRKTVYTDPMRNRILGSRISLQLLIIRVHRRNVPRDKTSQDVRSQGQNVLRDKTSHAEFSKTHFVLENWPHMLGNGPHLCNQFMIGVFLFW